MNCGRTTHFRSLLGGLVVLASLIMWSSTATAYPTWSCNGTEEGDGLCFNGDPTIENSGNCATCHGDYRSQRTYSSRTADDPAEWDKGLMRGHVRAFDLECRYCHHQGTKTPVYLNRGLFEDDDDGVGCVGCHGREADITPSDGAFGGPGPNLGDGLRAHHDLVLGFLFCGSCHFMDTPMPAGEDAPSSRLEDPCDDAAYGRRGLDNDGDGPRDQDDFDCPAGDDDDKSRD